MGKVSQEQKTTDGSYKLFEPCFIANHFFLIVLFTDFYVVFIALPLLHKFSSSRPSEIIQAELREECIKKSCNFRLGMKFNYAEVCIVGMLQRFSLFQFSF